MRAVRFTHAALQGFPPPVINRLFLVGDAGNRQCHFDRMWPGSNDAST